MVFSRRGFLGWAGLGLLGFGSGVWATPLHRRYEDEIARWWNEDGHRDIVYAPTLAEQMAVLYGQMADLRAFWPFFDSANDASGNNQHLTINYPASFSIKEVAAGLPYGEIADAAGVNLFRSHDLALSPEIITFGAWVRVGNTESAGAVLRLGDAGDVTYELGADAENGFYGSFGTGEYVELLGVVNGGLDWNFVVLRRDLLAVFLRVNQGQETAVSSGVGLPEDMAHSFSIGGDLITDPGVPIQQMDVALAFVAGSSVPDSVLDLIYASTRGFFGV